MAKTLQVSETIMKTIRRRVDIEAALTELGADLKSIAMMSKMNRVRHLRAYIYDLRMAVDADKLLFPEEQPDTEKAKGGDR
jgi:hypothetical protein